MISGTIVADTIGEKWGRRITTFSLVYPRFIHAELLTHRMFSRNSSSSRAIPFDKMVLRTEAEPIEWGKNRPGMQATEQVANVSKARDVWRSARHVMILHARELHELGVHKQVVNRLLEPFQLMNTVLTATEFDNFFKLRAHKDAQPEIQSLAFTMKELMEESSPEVSKLHAPYHPDPLISAARCARVSYAKHDGSTATKGEDQDLSRKLMEAGHMSPFEHYAREGDKCDFYYNLNGWKSNRYIMENEHVGSER